MTYREKALRMILSIYLAAIAAPPATMTMPTTIVQQSFVIQVQQDQLLQCRCDCDALPVGEDRCFGNGSPERDTGLNKTLSTTFSWCGCMQERCKCEPIPELQKRTMCDLQTIHWTDRKPLLDKMDPMSRSKLAKASTGNIKAVIDYELHRVTTEYKVPAADGVALGNALIKSARKKELTPFTFEKTVQRLKDMDIPDFQWQRLLVRSRATLQDTGAEIVKRTSPNEELMAETLDTLKDSMKLRQIRERPLEEIGDLATDPWIDLLGRGATVFKVLDGPMASQNPQDFHDAVRRLQEAGADFSVSNPLDALITIAASREPNTHPAAPTPETMIEFAELLFSLGAKADIPVFGEHNPLQLTTAAFNDDYLPFIDMLVKRGAPFDNADTFKITPLNEAVVEPGRKSTVYYLLDKGASITYADIDGNTPGNNALPEYLPMLEDFQANGHAVLERHKPEDYDDWPRYRMPTSE